MEHKHIMKVGSLFSGIGGFDLGLERAGMKVVWQVEKDSYCNKILQKHWPNVKRYGDIKEVGGDILDPVDLICGGFPCQPFSVSGKQQGKEDHRYIWPEMHRVIKELKPTWIIGENVVGIVKMELDNILSDLEGEGYTATPLIIPACAVDAKHRRDRVWIVGHSDTKKEQKLLAHTDDSTFPRQRQYGGKILSKSKSKRFGMGRAHGKHNEFKRKGGNGEGIIWDVEPDVGRVANGISNRMDRLRCLGNAVVPQIVEILGRAIMEVDKDAIY